MEQEEDRPEIWSVTEITQAIHKSLQNQFPVLWVRGEISNLRVQASGHRYFMLKDENCQLKAVFFEVMRLVLLISSRRAMTALLMEKYLFTNQEGNISYEFGMFYKMDWATSVCSLIDLKKNYCRKDYLKSIEKKPAKLCKNDWSCYISRWSCPAGFFKYS